MVNGKIKNNSSTKAKTDRTIHPSNKKTPEPIYIDKIRKNI
jgi:hypothetical protein